MTRDFLPMKSGASFRRHATNDGVPQTISRRRAVRAERVAWWSLAGAGIAVIAVGSMLASDLNSFYPATSPVTKGALYQVASAPTTGRFIAVRFVAQATAADIDNFLKNYKVSMVETGRKDGYYRIRISDRPLQQDERAELVARMGQEKVVDFITVQQ
jgi:hypothetical protein